MATATSTIRYTLTLSASEARTLIAILANVYIPAPASDRFEADVNNLIHIHEVLAKQGLDTQYVFPLVAGD
jgi:hypothetical protein